MSAVLAPDSPRTLYAGSRDLDGELALFMRDYERPLYTFLVTLVRDVDLAMDCVQDTFLRAYEALKKGKSINGAWLFTVARNRAMDEFRRKRWVRVDADALAQIPDHRSADQAVAVQSVLDQLAPTDRQVLFLFIVAGFRTDEIGTILGMNGSAIRQRLYRARERFRALYERGD